MATSALTGSDDHVAPLSQGHGTRLTATAIRTRRKTPGRIGIIQQITRRFAARLPPLGWLTVRSMDATSGAVARLPPLPELAA